MSYINLIRSNKRIKYFIYFLLGVVSPIISNFISEWIPFLNIGYSYLLITFIFFFLFIKLFNIKWLESQIIIFLVVFLLPLFTWFCLFLLFLTYYGLTPLFYDMSEVCNPPGPDGPNCQYCSQGTIGCGDVYKKNE
ncbi:hypothetical protein DNJ73_00355 [Prochlorococcus marinus XMU1408]|uniref:Uncharacterized protein n=1 Tax=Prochlorococcus marinus XMU1408 TaxID=2213228 RepID=A0A318R2C5_PROMR|nr:hypothetical protein [Prochlorococcus marinus str. XMU1408]PYE03675.1 hypothetical protein DNJ73_00355 [Prochlorococcus marinus XMU1408]